MITLSRASALINYLKPAHNTSPFHTCIDPSISLLKLLDLSIETLSLKLTHQSHAVAHRVGLTQHPIIAQKLIFSYCKFKNPVDAQLVFDSVSVKNTHICNTLLSGYGKNHLFTESFELFRVLHLPDEFTFSVIFKSVGDYGDVLYGEMVHAMSVKNGVALDTVVGNSLMSMYGKCGSFNDFLKVFDEMPQRNASSWNALISGFAKENVENIDRMRLWDLVKGMQFEGLRFDAITVSTLLSLCSDDDCNRDYGHGRELHCYVVKNGLDLSSGSNSDVHLGSCLIDMYSKNGKVGLGKRVFDRLKWKNIFAWTSMINGYVHSREFNKALLLFREMQWRDTMVPNKVSLVTILPACSSLAGLTGGKQIHGFAIRHELNHELSLCNALIDTYSKSGGLTYAIRVFDHECINKDAISYSSIIFGHGLHGEGQNAVTLFDKMLRNGFKPDTTVIISILSACSRSGLLKDGIRIYESVVNEHKINPTVEMCSCVVDMLGRAGQLNRAHDFIKLMDIEAGPTVWGALLCASAIHGDLGMQEIAYKSLIEIEPENSSNYVTLSNLYAASKRWDGVAEVRKGMKERGLKKMPGCSWISLNSVTHSFFVADKSHPCSRLIYEMLDELVSTMKLTCYNPDFVS